MEHLGFEDLEVYKAIRNYSKCCYILLRKFPLEERYALCDQLRRSVISIGSNLAEGYGRYGLKEKVSFLSIANGSLYETYHQMQMAFDFNYINEIDFNGIKTQVYKISRMLHGLRLFYIKQVETSKPNT